MKRIELEIKALSPLAISRQKPGGSVSEAEDYIPGTVIRGAIAAQILQQSGHLSTDLSQNGGDFQSLFLGTKPAIFQNAYSIMIKLLNRTIALPEVRVLPATALSSKNNSGFKSSDPKNNGVFDTLIDRFCAEGYGHPYDPNCPTDGERVDAFTGLYGRLNDKYYSPSTSKRLLTRVGINRHRATAEEQILYSIEVLNESEERRQKPAIYRSSILVDNDLADALTGFIQTHSQSFRLGGSASRGLGKVEIKTKPAVDLKSTVKERVKQFNQKLQKRWNDWKIFGNPKDDLLVNRQFFTIALQADAILTEQWRRTTVISAAMLKESTGVDDLPILHVVYSSYDYRSGWNAAWGLPKDVELITNKGAVYLFSVSSDRQEEWIKALENLEINGVGDRTSEGFGQVQICNEFHLVLREEAV